MEMSATALVPHLKGVQSESSRSKLIEADDCFVSGNQIGDEFAGDGGEGEPHHGMAGGDDEVVLFWGASEVGEAVGGAGTEADPGGKVCEVGGLVLGVEFAKGFDNTLEAGFADGGVFTADFHGAGDAEGVAHGGDGDTSFFEEGAEERVGFRRWKGDGVTFAALHGEAETDLLGEVGGVDSACEDDGFGLVGFSGFGGDAFDFAVGGSEFGDFVDDEFPSISFDGVTEGGDEFLRREVTILRPPDAAFGFNLGVGFEFLEAGGVTDFGLEAELVGVFGDFGFFFESGLGLAEHKEAFLGERKVFLFGEFDVEAAAFEREVAKEFLGVGDVFFGGVFGKEPDPASEGRGEAGAEKEGALGVDHPFQALGDDAGGGEGNEVGGNDHAGVALGATAGVGVIALDDADGVAGLGEVVGSGETDNSATDDEDVLRHGRVGWKVVVRPRDWCLAIGFLANSQWLKVDR
jgi:hypothetical protein